MSLIFVNFLHSFFRERVQQHICPISKPWGDWSIIVRTHVGARSVQDLICGRKRRRKKGLFTIKRLSPNIKREKEDKWTFNSSAQKEKEKVRYIVQVRTSRTVSRKKKEKKTSKHASCLFPKLRRFWGHIPIHEKANIGTFTYHIPVVIWVFKILKVKFNTHNSDF